MRSPFWMGMVLLLAIGSGRAQSSDAPVPTIRVAARIVRVPVAATRPDGSRVEDLRASELQVFDNGRRQTIASFEPMSAPAGEAGGSHPGQLRPAEIDPHFSIILLDALNTEWSDQASARSQIEHLLDTVPAGELIAIFVLGEHLYLLHDFSANTAELRAALHRFSAGPPHGGASSAETRGFSAASSTPNLSAFANLRSRAAGSAAEEEFYLRSRIVETFDTLTTISGMVKNIPGQKDLLWVSSAFPLTVNGRHGEMDSVSMYGPMEEATRTLSSAGLRLYPVDARGLAVSLGSYVNIDTMRIMADKTGGRAFYNSNDLSGEMRMALQDSASGYLLTYVPQDLREDGSFHRIRLRVLRPGVKLRYRAGYYGPSFSATR